MIDIIQSERSIYWIRFVIPYEYFLIIDCNSNFDMLVRINDSDVFKIETMSGSVYITVNI